MSYITKREQQILEWIKENPMICQQDLADLAGISRSGMAAHISNLMKKGYIVGKGYVISEPDYIVVIGGVSVDICGTPYKKPVGYEANPGKVVFSYGGAGRNIAHNLSLLGRNVKFITVFGGDVYAQGIREYCKENGLDISESLQIPGEATSSYLFVTDENGMMREAISDMGIYRYISREFIREKMDIINEATACVIDTNLPQDTIEYLAKYCKVPIFADPVSRLKANRLRFVLDKLYMIYLNRMEAEALTGISITDEKTLEKVTDSLLDSGIKEVFLYLEQDGILCCDHQTKIKISCHEIGASSCTGVRNAGLAALVWAYMMKMGLEEKGKASLAASSICLESQQAVNLELSAEALRKKIKREVK